MEDASISVEEVVLVSAVIVVPVFRMSISNPAAIMPDPLFVVIDNTSACFGRCTLNGYRVGCLGGTGVILQP